MYSKQLRDFVEAHRPAKVVWGEARVRELAAKAGLEVRPAGHYDDISSWSREGEGLILVKWGKPTGRNLRKRAPRSWLASEIFGLEPKWVETDQPEREHAFIQIEFPLTVKWEDKVEGSVVTYRSDCRFGGSSSGKVVAWPTEDLLSTAGLKAITVELPETTVTLPRAPWDHTYPYDWGSGMIEETITCYLSEAPAIVAPFISQLAKLADLAVVRKDDLYEALGQIRGTGSYFPPEIWERLTKALGA